MSDANAFVEPDPRQALRALIERGAGNSAQAIMLRLLWLRREHPEAAVTTEAVRVEDDAVVMRATILLRSGAAGSGIAAARVAHGDDWADIVERTETVAISRALDTLGYVVGTVTERSPVSEPVREVPRPEAPTPEPRPQAPPVQAPPAVQPPGPEPAAQGRERFAPPARVDEAAPPVVSALRRANRRPAVPEGAPAAPAAVEDDAHLAEYSWNTFWSRARELGLTPAKVTEVLGRPANQMSPKEAVSGLVEAGVWPGPDGE